MERAKRFCASVVPKDLEVQGAIAMSSLLWVKVSRPTAMALMRDTLSAEQVVKLWMQKWKAETGSQVVTVTVEFGDVQIAEGETSIFRGDQVTVRRP